MINDINTASYKYSKILFSKREVEILNNTNRAILPANDLFQNSSFACYSNQILDLANELDEIRAEMDSGKKFEGDVKSLAKKLDL